MSPPSSADDDRLGLGLIQQVPVGGADCYLAIPDIPGESRVVGHEDQIEVHGIAWSVQRPSMDGRTRSRPTASEVVVTAAIDAGAAQLLDAVVRGRVVPEARLTWASSSGDARVARATLLLRGVLVTSWESRSVDSMPAVQLTLAYERLRFRYREVSDDGSPGAAHEVEYDLATPR